MTTTTPIVTRDDFVSFLEQLCQQLREGRDEWTNTSLQDFLEALAAWAEDMDGYYANIGLAQQIDLSKERVPWRVFADMLLAARVYE